MTRTKSAYGGWIVLLLFVAMFYGCASSCTKDNALAKAKADKEEQRLETRRAILQSVAEHETEILKKNGFLSFKPSESIHQDQKILSINKKIFVKGFKIRSVYYSSPGKLQIEGGFGGFDHEIEKEIARLQGKGLPQVVFHLSSKETPQKTETGDGRFGAGYSAFIEVHSVSVYKQNQLATPALIISGNLVKALPEKEFEQLVMKDLGINKLPDEKL